MRITRTFTDGRQVALRRHRLPHGLQRDPQSGRLGGVPRRRHRGAERLVAGRGRRARPEVFPQGRRPGALRPVDDPSVPEWLRRRRPTRRRSPTCPPDRATAARPRPSRCSTASPAPGPSGAGRAATSTARRRARVLRRAALMLARQMAAPNSPQWFNTGLHWAYGIDGPAQGHYFADHQSGEVRHSTSAYERRSRTPASSRASPTTWSIRAASWTCGCARRACSSTAPAPAPTSPPARRERAALGRRQVVRPDELPQDRRPRRRRDQVGRHHAARGQDGRGRRRPSRHRGVRRLEGGRGAEGRGAGRRLEAARPPPERDHDRLPCRRAGRRGALRRQGEPGAQAGDPRGAPALLPESACSRRSCTPARATPGSTSRPTRPTGTRRLPDRLGAELQQLGARHQRVPGAGGRGREWP